MLNIYYHNIYSKFIKRFLISIILNKLYYVFLSVLNINTYITHSDK